jgi:hypothetical protein
VSLHRAIVDELDRLDRWRTVRTVKALAAAVELHEEFHYERFGMDCCGECSDVESGVFVGAPCETVQAIARELGIEATDHG